MFRQRSYIAAAVGAALPFAQLLMRPRNKQPSFTPSQSPNGTVGVEQAPDSAY
jgi:hypothetical protein